jgi:hypothetical protein
VKDTGEKKHVQDTAARARQVGGPDDQGRRHGEEVLSLMRVGDRSARSRHDLCVGDRALVGSCQCPECGVDVLVAATTAHWCLAEVVAEATRWHVTNLSVDSELWLVDMEDERQHVRLPPGRVGVSVPFEFSRLHFRHAGHEVSDSVVAIGQEQRFVARPRACRQSYRPVVEAMLKPGTTYMAVIEELCRTGGVVTPPTSTQIATRLSSAGLPVTRKAVDRHIDYVYGRLFPTGTTPRSPGSKRLAVASVFTRACAGGMDVFSASTTERHGVKAHDRPAFPVTLADRLGEGSARPRNTEPDPVRKREIHTP